MKHGVADMNPSFVQNAVFHEAIKLEPCQFHHFNSGTPLQVQKPQKSISDLHTLTLHY